MKFSVLNESRRISPAIAILAVTATWTALSFPGVLLSDGAEQLRQARAQQYTDWHPPLMAVVWSWLVRTTEQPGLLLVLHQLMYGAGFALFADGLFRADMRARAWLIGVAACFPLFIFYNRLLIKDVGMASALAGSVGLLFWFAIQRHRRPMWATAVAALLLAYGVLVRFNAIFAFGPLLLLLAPRLWKFRLSAAVCVSIGVSIVALPITDFVNHRLLGAERLDVMQQLQIFDLMGIEARTGDESVWGDRQVSAAEVQSCYTPVWWDTFSSWGTCAWIRSRIGQEGNTYSQKVVAERLSLWRQAILLHPAAYFAHRLSHFNASIYFFVPSFHIRYKSVSGDYSGDAAEVASGESLRRKILLDYVKRTFLVWPVTWLVLGACVLVFLARETSENAITAFSKFLILSGLLYSLAYFFVGIATEVRYHYWSIIAICVGCLLSIDIVTRGFSERTFRGQLALALMLGTVALGYLARILDVALP